MKKLFLLSGVFALANVGAVYSGNTNNVIYDQNAYYSRAYEKPAQQANANPAQAEGNYYPASEGYYLVGTSDPVWADGTPVNGTQKAPQGNTPGNAQSTPQSYPQGNYPNNPQGYPQNSPQGNYPSSQAYNASGYNTQNYNAYGANQSQNPNSNAAALPHADRNRRDHHLYPTGPFSSYNQKTYKRNSANYTNVAYAQPNASAQPNAYNQQNAYGQPSMSNNPGMSSASVPNSNPNTNYNANTGSYTSTPEYNPSSTPSYNPGNPGSATPGTPGNTNYQPGYNTGR